jgi:hypothetical protein
LEGKCAEKMLWKRRETEENEKVRMKIFENCLEYVTKAGEAYAPSIHVYTEMCEAHAL